MRIMNCRNHTAIPSVFANGKARTGWQNRLLTGSGVVVVESQPTLGVLLFFQLLQQLLFIGRIELVPVHILKGAGDGEQQGPGGSEAA